MQANKAQIHRKTRYSSGFSLLEILAVLAIILVAAAVSLPMLNLALQDASVSNGYDTTLMTIRQAREAAITQRRVYIVTLTTPNSISIAPKNEAADALIVNLTMPKDVEYTAITGIPNTTSTTPDGFGTGPSTGAICFDVGVTSTGTNTLYFWPDGSARDANGNMNSGVVYIARKNDLMSSRAITVWGASGRIRGWRLSKNTTSGLTFWRQQ